LYECKRHKRIVSDRTIYRYTAKITDGPHKSIQGKQEHDLTSVKESAHNQPVHSVHWQKMRQKCIKFLGDNALIKFLTNYHVTLVFSRGVASKKLISENNGA